MTPLLPFYGGRLNPNPPMDGARIGVVASHAPGEEPALVVVPAKLLGVLVLWMRFVPRVGPPRHPAEVEVLVDEFP